MMVMKLFSQSRDVNVEGFRHLKAFYAPEGFRLRLEEIAQDSNRIKY